MKKKQGGGNDSSFIVIEHEYILVYTKVIEHLKLNNNDYFVDENSYPFEDEYGKYNLVTLDKSSIQFFESLYYKIVGSDGKILSKNY